MKFSERTQRVAAPALLVLMLSVVGCATQQQADQPEQQVVKLAAQRWAWLIDAEWKPAYDLLTPGYRALHTLKEYREKFQSAHLWQKAVVSRAECQADKCDVHVALTVTSPLARKPGVVVETNFTETWLREGGRWYYYEKP